MTAKKKKRMYCPYVHYLSVGKGQADTVISRVRCKRWMCEYCAYVNYVQWMMRLIRGMEKMRGLERMQFVTVTVPGYLREPWKSAKRLQSGLSKLLKRMRRKNITDDMPYVRVFEAHADGTLHAHLIIHWYTQKGFDAENDEKMNKVHTRWLKDNAPSCGLGNIADCRVINTAYDPERDASIYEQDRVQVASYVMKYMAKGFTTEGMNEENRKIIDRHRYPRMRVIQASQHFPPSLATDTDANERDWSITEKYADIDYFIDRKRGPVFDVQAGRQLTLSDFTWGWYDDRAHIEPCRV